MFVCSKQTNITGPLQVPLSLLTMGPIKGKHLFILNNFKIKRFQKKSKLMHLFRKESAQTCVIFILETVIFFPGLILFTKVVCNHRFHVITCISCMWPAYLETWYNLSPRLLFKSIVLFVVLSSCSSQESIYLYARLHIQRFLYDFNEYFKQNLDTFNCINMFLR